MKYSIFFLIFLTLSCNANLNYNNKITYTAKGFAYIYNDNDYKNKIIKGKLNNEELQVSINALKTNSLIKIINTKTNDSIVLKNIKKIYYPDFYKILITKKVAEKLNIDKDLPLVEIIEIKKNKSFVAKKAKIFNEEKKISSNAPVASVKISNISKNKKKQTKNFNEDMYILIATFYAKETAEFLQKRIIKEMPKYDKNKLKIKRIKNNVINLISGPYNTINLMKNDYIELKKFGFEELDITIYE